MSAKTGNLLGLIVVTGCAAVVAIQITARGRGSSDAAGDGDAERTEKPAAVAVMQVEQEQIGITDTYSGRIQPFERFSLGFEIAGRVSALGANQRGESLDDGDRVSAGQVLAKLDDRKLRSLLDQATAQQAEAASRILEADAGLTDAQAQLTDATADMKRSEDLKQSGSRVLTDAEYEDDVAKLASATAQLAGAKAKLAAAKANRTFAEARVKTAERNLEDSTLVAPADAVIAKRMLNPGETVNPQQMVMELIQIDQVVLVVGVPEAYVSEIQVGQEVDVELLARDRFRQKRPSTRGRVYRVAEAADQTTSLFEVEVLVPNADRVLKPGLIALAHIIVDRVEGFRVPVTCVMFTDEGTFLYAVGEDDKAHRVDLTSDSPNGDYESTGRLGWIEQGPHLIIPGLPPDRRTIVTRGQHRLIDQRAVERVDMAEADLPSARDIPPLREVPAATPPAD